MRTQQSSIVKVKARCKVQSEIKTIVWTLLCKRGEAVGGRPNHKCIKILYCFNSQSRWCWMQYKVSSQNVESECGITTHIFRNNLNVVFVLWVHARAVEWVDSIVCVTDWAMSFCEYFYLYSSKFADRFCSLFLKVYFSHRWNSD